MTVSSGVLPGRLRARAALVPLFLPLPAPSGKQRAGLVDEPLRAVPQIAGLRRGRVTEPIDLAHRLIAQAGAPRTAPLRVEDVHECGADADADEQRPDAARPGR